MELKQSNKAGAVGALYRSERHAALQNKQARPGSQKTNLLFSHMSVWSDLDWAMKRAGGVRKIPYLLFGVSQKFAIANSARPLCAAEAQV